MCSTALVRIVKHQALPVLFPALHGPAKKMRDNVRTRVNLEVEVALTDVQATGHMVAARGQ
jgi:hypothetical protein